MTLFDTYRIPVTWAVVGRLIEPEPGIPSRYPFDLNRLFDRINTETVYRKVPVSERHFPGLIELLRNSSTAHELGSHTYNHLHCSKIQSGEQEIFRCDFEAMHEIFEEYGLLPARSLVFPRNELGGLDQLKQTSIRIYRAPDRYWYSDFPKFLVKLLRQFDYIIPIPPRTFSVEEDEFGNAFVRGSMLYTTSHIGYKRFIPSSLNAFRVRRGLDRAVRRGEILHLWFHPFNYGYRKEAQFRGLESVLRYAMDLRSRGLLETVTMGSLIN